MSKVCDVVEKLAQPIAEQFGCSLWDVEYNYEGADWYLRIFIDNEKGITIEDCENVSRALDVELDRVDPISTSYILEVASAGLTRALKKPQHFEYAQNKLIDIKLYRALEGKKEFTGELVRFDGDLLVLKIDGNEIEFEMKNIASSNLAFVG